MRKTKNVDKNSAEWNYCQFRLQTTLSQPNIKLKNLQANQVLAQQYFGQQRHRNFKLDACIDVSEWSQQKILSLKSNSLQSQVFKCGFININPSSSSTSHRMILLKLSIQFPLPVLHQPMVSTQDYLKFITNDYDSVYLAHKTQQTLVYQHDYIVKNKQQYCWQYDVQFQYTHDKDKTSEVKRWKAQNWKCQECQEQKAQFLCQQEKQLFCRICYDDLHQGRLRTNHKRLPISPFNCYNKCQKPAHNSNLLEFYCFNCKQTKCSKCVNDSIHKSQLSQKSELKDLKQKGHQWIQIDQLVPMLQLKQQQFNIQLKSTLLTKISQIQILISSINKSYLSNLALLQQQLAKQIFQLKSQSLLDINKAVSIHSQLKRKYDQIIWTQKFVSYNQEVLDLQSNIHIKEGFATYIQKTKFRQYIDNINNRIQKVKHQSLNSR